MSENTTEVAVGAGVVALALGFLIYAGQVTGFSSGATDAYHLTASFRSAEGIGSGTDVRLAGVKIGTVTALDLNPETYRAEAQLTLDKSVVLPDDTAALISSEGLLGGNFVELVPGGSMFNFEDGQVIADTQGSISLINLMLKFVTGSDTGSDSGSSTE
ncbi:phospholipid/cholesterol/gamma-HCH transport system substrate-binding protein [Celeribacter baekdonensis]|jgi:phospholipid/cholesterol/gamma-HCH transport system substrate-binding protein|uniref:Phospholipid/cholesterol/gamma-HCH transport system substrate-binding protein n=1 Tax=Celeribacter baekdonensis TaxID=875171 RepID=A0A1G7IU84_9RHOB|nr:outer membrane lipid asymmetry maintenance protein MlaD [Celeribacter baekdonensis]SDF16260.1 phospholipid/cholesterol/gamma-HCH transport system substrate-binding protein [Celeribacter baekdonensis]